MKKKKVGKNIGIYVAIFGIVIAMAFLYDGGSESAKPTESAKSGNVSVKMFITTTTTYNSTVSTSKTVVIGYKLKNSAGIIVDSGSFYISPTTTGETAINSTYINGRLSMQESYTLELLNSTD